MNPVTIIGGGLAGLTLGIGLRQREVPVVLWEATSYPRHRVCGEFISGQGLLTWQKLGLGDLLPETATRRARTAAFFSTDRPGPVRVLPAEALCVSRHELDARLAARFRDLGGELRTGVRWKEGGPPEGVVKATGRPLRTHESKWSWYGLKAHARDLELSADLEMHFTDRGYVGLCRLPGGVVNVCGLFRRCRSDPPLGAEVAARFADGAGPELRARLAGATWIEDSVCAVAGLSYRRPPGGRSKECSIGDAMAMIPPVTGNGMSMAFESAELALNPLVDYAAGRADWPSACGGVRADLRQAFSRRLWGARGLHRLIFSKPLRKRIIPWVARSEWAWRFFFRITR